MLLNLDHVQKHYGDFHLDCSLQLPEGRITGLIGANGAGKSTTFKAILDLIRVDGGTIEIFGKDRKSISLKDKADLGVVLADSTFSYVLTVKDVMAIMGAMYNRFDRERFIKKCEQYDIPFNKQIKDFSTGMKAKLKLLIAMSYEARLLILDEPTVGLDVMTRGNLLDELREYMEDGRGILISSHISTDLEGLCDDLYFIQNGKIGFHEETDVIMADYGLLKVSEEQYRQLEQREILYRRKEAYGWSLLTGNRQFYLDNYHDLVIEKGSIDEVITMMEEGERV